ncbi:MULTISPECIES: hypothetical protein [unclassified Rummeliibacillus]|uniref:hypothetical protein n=1 Tax=unclassified Rummeliibacillus TaxID=2622809 RepID=UPI0013DDE011|nr:MULTISPECIES: hypothetical protein [unclassified Rummeliibacillus]
MSQRDRVSIIVMGVIIGVIFGLIFKDMYHCLITGVVVASIITIKLSQQAKKSKTCIHE